MKDSDDTRAAAITYDGFSTPKVVARGEAELAEQILRLAEENGIPIRKDQTLSALLAQVDIGAEIPPMLYVAVAEALAFAYALQDDLHWIDENETGGY